MLTLMLTRPLAMWQPECGHKMPGVFSIVPLLAGKNMAAV